METSTTGSDSPSSMSVRSVIHTTPNCYHDFPAEILTSHSEKNPGRRFFTCSVRKWDDCEFFQWVDSTTPLSFCYNQCARRLKLQKESYDKQLECKDMAESYLSEKLRMKTEECDYLKAKVEKLKKKKEEFECVKTELMESVKEAEKLKKWRWLVIQKLGALVILVAIVVKFVSS